MLCIITIDNRARSLTIWQSLCVIYWTLFKPFLSWCMPPSWLELTSLLKRNDRESKATYSIRNMRRIWSFKEKLLWWCITKCHKELMPKRTITANKIIPFIKDIWLYFVPVSEFIYILKKLRRHLSKQVCSHCPNIFMSGNLLTINELIWCFLLWDYFQISVIFLIVQFPIK